MKIVIIGGVAGGMSAATRLRRLNEKAEIIVLEKSGYVSYANCGLPYFVGGVIENENSLLLQTPESLHQRFALDVRIKSEAFSIDKENKTVQVKNLVNNEVYELSYDKLILSPGASPVVPPITGVEHSFTLRNVEDVERIVEQVAQKPQSAVVIGGGFIGVEVAENLIHKSIKTTLIEATPQVLAPLDPEMATLVANEMTKHNIDLILEDSVVEITPQKVVLKSGREVPAQMVVLAIGVKPDISLAKNAGLTIGTRNGILVDEFHLTSNADIYAIGDAVEKKDAIDGSQTLIPLANIANRQGRVVSDHINGRKNRPIPSIGTAIVKVFDLMVATTGWNEKRLKASNKPFMVIHTHPNSHAGYYPGAKPMALKLLIDPNTQEILGAQGIGTDGVDKRIDVIATSIRAGIKAPELADLELAYAPPFSSAKDPVNMLGYLAENLLSNLSKTAQWHEIDELISQGYVLVDVRSKSEFDQAGIPGALNISVDELRQRHTEIGSKKVLVHCQVGQRGHTAAMLLNQLGYEAINLDGGFLTWKNSPSAINQLVTTK
jgi:NADPH-dependent 2,4-dienoyl-CoA reductase/sulfur reductase-like enzyme/rhodanese-related sulfurtransferase